MSEFKLNLTSIINFAIHSIVGACLFVTIGIPAFALNWFVGCLAIHGASEFIIQTLTFLEHGILVIDVIAVAIYILTSTYREIKEMING